MKGYSPETAVISKVRTVYLMINIENLLIVRML